MTGAKHGKTCNGRLARENAQTAPSAGKRLNGTQRGKACNRRPARENMLLAPSAGKNVAGVNYVMFKKLILVC